MHGKQLGNCGVCKQRNVKIRPIDLYVAGSEGIIMCNDCEIILVNFVRTLQSVGSIGFKSGYTKDWKEEA